MASRFPSLQTSKERPSCTGSSDIAPSGLGPSHPSIYQSYMHSEFQNLSHLSVPQRGPSETANYPIINGFPQESLPYLTGSVSESDLTGNNGVTFPFPPYLPSYGCQTMAPLSPMQQPLHGDHHREIPIAAVDERQEVVPVRSMDPSFTAHASHIPSAYPPDCIPDAHHSTWYAHTTNPSRSAGDVPCSASPTTLQFPHVQRTSFRTFIDDNPVFNKAYDIAKEKVATYPIIKASNARRQNAAPFTCEHCQATFTRSHNLTYHLDSHFGRKKHSSLCGKKFGTPSGSKRHQGTCSKCRGASGSKRDTLSPG